MSTKTGRPIRPTRRDFVAGALAAEAGAAAAVGAGRALGVGTFPVYDKGDDLYVAGNTRLRYSDTSPVGTAPPDPLILPDLAVLQRDQLTQRFGQGRLTKVAAVYDRPFWREEGRVRGARRALIRTSEPLAEL